MMLLATIPGSDTEKKEEEEEPGEITNTKDIAGLF